MGTQPSILVVDDDALSGELAGAVLEDAGYTVVLAEGAVDALAKLASEAGIGLIVSDLNMPFMGGLQLFPGDRRGVHGAVCDSVGAVHDFGADGEAYAGGNGLLLPGVQAVPG